MSKGVHNVPFYVSPDPECSRTTQNSEISLAPSRGRILYAIYGNSTCVLNHIVVTARDKRYRNYYVSTRVERTRRINDYLMDGRWCWVCSHPRRIVQKQWDNL